MSQSHITKKMYDYCLQTKIKGSYFLKNHRLFLWFLSSLKLPLYFIWNKYIHVFNHDARISHLNSIDHNDAIVLLKKKKMICYCHGICWKYRRIFVWDCKMVSLFLLPFFFYIPYFPPFLLFKLRKRVGVDLTLISIRKL